MTREVSTALITGASSGIGRAFAHAFAERGADLIVVARRGKELDALAVELRAAHGIDVTTIACDLSASESASTLLNTLSSTQVDVLVNNAGFGTNNRVEDENRDTVRAEIGLNVTTLTDLTVALLPGMLERGSGTIINIASTAAFQPVPGMAVYAATKSYVLSFTRALWVELRGTGVRALAVCPGATDTEFFRVAGAAPSTGLAPVADVIDQTFAALESGGPSVVVGGRNRAMAFATRFAPVTTVMRVAAAMFLPPRR